MCESVGTCATVHVDTFLKLVLSLCPGFSGLNSGCEACTASPTTKLGNSAFHRDERKHRYNCCTLQDQKGVLGQLEHDVGSRKNKLERQQAAASENQIHFCSISGFVFPGSFILGTFHNELVPLGLSSISSPRELT